MPSLEDSLSFEGAFPITFDLTGSDDLSVSSETPPLGVLNSNPSPSTVSSEAPTVSASPANDLTAVSNFASTTFTLAESLGNQPANDEQDGLNKLFRDGWIGQDHPPQLFSGLHGGDLKAPGPCTCSQCSLPPVDPRWIVTQTETLKGLPLTTLDLTQTFLLNSLPGANHTIYLDFNGHTTTGTPWNGAGRSSIVTPAFDIDGNPAGFSTTELERIQYIWQRVVEDFSPFNVNVTTQEPTLDRLIKSGTTDTAWGVRVAIGGSSYDWFGAGAGGVAYLNSFNWDSDTPTFVFTQQLGGDEKSTAEAISHEVGHTLGLYHDGRTSPSEGYYYGHGSGETGWAPIMGVGYYQNLTQWSKGQYLAANNTEDDLAIITTANGFGYRVDDTGDTLGTAKALTVSVTAVSASGIIERNTDVDFFSFTTGDGGISLTVTPSGRGPNLDILAELYNASGVLVARSNPADFLAASISATVSAGTYYLKVDGVGKGDPLGTGYTDYGSLGQYGITGTIISGTKTISIAKTTDGNEAGPVSSVFTLTRTGDLSSALTVNYTLAGTATPDVDYTGTTPNSVTFAAGSSTATFTLPTIDDSEVDPSETIITKITAPAGYTISGADTATATILDNEFTTYFWDDFANNSQGWTLGTEWQIGAATTSTGQNYGNPDPGTDNTPTADNGVAGVVIGGNASTALHGFYYLTSPIINTSTANQLFFEYARWLNSDYTPYMQNTVEIFNGSSWVNLLPNNFDDSPGVRDSAWTPQQFDISAHKSASTQIRFGFNVTDSDVYTVSSWNLDDVKIYGDGGGATKSISIAKTSDGNEAGSVSSVFTLTRTGDLSSALTVNYTLAGTATLDSDYNDPSLGQATFAAGSSTATITLATIDDSEVDPSETIITKITAPAGYTISGPDTVTATLIDNELGTLTLGKTTDGNEAGPVSSVFTLTRTGDLSSALTVNYTLTGTATLGVDYTGTTPNSVTFAAGSSTATITLPTIDDLLSDSSETIITKITAPAGYTISGADTATATILDNDGDADNNNLVGTSFADALAGVGGNDTLDGGVGDDTLDGGVGDDTLDGGVGVDSMDGGDDNDTYYVDNVGDIVKEVWDDDLGGTADTVFASVTYSLSPGTPDNQGYGIENLTLTGSADINATGNDKNNVLTGNSGNNVLDGGVGVDSMDGGNGNDTLFGGLGNDTLFGGLGSDTLDGGADNDTYLFDTDLVLGSDRLIDASGIDTLNFAATTTKTINLNLGSTAGQTVTAGNLTLTLASATAFENVIGGSLNDTIVGNSLANSLTGEAGNDSLTGGVGKDSLTGSDGLDTLNYNSLGESLLSGFDVIQGYSGTGASLDSINAPGSIAAITLTASKGTAASLTAAAIQLVLTNAAFAANTAAAFKVTGQSGIFIALNNGVAGFQAASDAIIQLSGYDIAVATPVVVI